MSSVQTREKLCGVAQDDGRLLWEQEVPAFRGMNILTPTVIEDRIFTSSYGGKSLLYQVSHGDGEWRIEPVWTNNREGYMSSPVVVGNHLYLHLRNQRFTCLNLADGQDAWTSTSFGKYWSLVVNGERILALDEKGELLLIDADPTEFKLISRREVSATDSWAHLAVADDLVLVRSLDALIAYRWRTP